MDRFNRNVRLRVSIDSGANTSICHRLMSKGEIYILDVGRNIGCRISNRKRLPAALYMCQTRS